MKFSYVCRVQNGCWQDMLIYIKQTCLVIFNIFKEKEKVTQLILSYIFKIMLPVPAHATPHPLIEVTKITKRSLFFLLF